VRWRGRLSAGMVLAALIGGGFAQGVADLPGWLEDGRRALPGGGLLSRAGLFLARGEGGAPSGPRNHEDIRCSRMEKPQRPRAIRGVRIAARVEAGAARAAALIELVGAWAWQAGAGAGALTGMLAWRGWRARRRSYRLPEFEQAPRLGGGHAAGIGAVISFPSGGGPPTMQRDQRPDDPRRS